MYIYKVAISSAGLHYIFKSVSIILNFLICAKVGQNINISHYNAVQQNMLAYRVYYNKCVLQ